MQIGNHFLTLTSGLRRYVQNEAVMLLSFWLETKLILLKKGEQGINQSGHLAFSLISYISTGLLTWHKKKFRYFYLHIRHMVFIKRFHNMFAIILIWFSKILARKYLLVYVLFEYYNGRTESLLLPNNWLNSNFVKSVWLWLFC